MRPGGTVPGPERAPHPARNQVVLLLLSAFLFTLWWVALALGMYWEEMLPVLIVAAGLLLAGMLWGIPARRAAKLETDRQDAPGRGPEP